MAFTWRQLTSPTAENLNASIYCYSKFWAFGNKGIRVFTTTDPVTLDSTGGDEAGDFLQAARGYTGGYSGYLLYLQAGNYTTVVSSVSWTSVSPLFHPVNYNDIYLTSYGANLAVAVGDNGAVWYIDLTDESYAAEASPPTASTLHGIDGYDATHIWAVGDSGALLFCAYDDDPEVEAYVWSSELDGMTENLNGIVVDNTDGRLRILVVGDNGTIYRYDSGAEAAWTVDASGITGDLYTCCYNGGLYLAAGAGGVVLLGFDAYAMAASVAGGHGTVTPATFAAYPGEDVTFTITPDQGYEVAHIYDNGVAQAAAESYTVSGVAADHSIIVDFQMLAAPDVWTVVTVTGEL